MPARSQPVIRRQPTAARSLAVAMPEAPTPENTTEMSPIFFLTTRSAQERSQHDHRRTMLIVVKDRDIEHLAETLLDLEAARRPDVFEVDAAEGRRDRPDDAHDLVHVLGGQADREGVDTGERLEQERLAFHDGQGGPGADVA